MAYITGTGGISQSKPKGTIIEFKVNTGNSPEIPSALQNVTLIQEEDVVLNFASEFSPVMSKSVSNVEKLATDVLSGATGIQLSSQFKEFGFQTWRGTSPVSFSLTFTLAMQTDAKADVVEPCEALIGLVLPDDTGARGSLVLPSPNILSILGIDDSPQGTSTVISCKLGFLDFPSVIVKKATPVFSKELDEQGFPIWCKMQMDVESVYTATRSMLRTAMKV